MTYRVIITRDGKQTGYSDHDTAEAAERCFRQWSNQAEAKGSVKHSANLYEVMV